MLKCSLPLLLIAVLATSTGRPETDRFAGTWKLDPSRSAMPDRMKVEHVGADRYAFDFGGGPETVVVDGTDQPTSLYGGGTLAVGVDGSRWKVVRKTSDGHVLLTALWSLSRDGRSLTDHFTGSNADGSPYQLNYVYRREGGGTGFEGAWASTSLKAVNYVVVLQLRPREDGGIAIVDSASTFTGNLEFDSSSVHRLDARTLELMRKKGDAPASAMMRLALSSDLARLTITPHSKAGDRPHVYVFERQ